MRQAITSLWSPKIDRAWVATVRAVTWKTVGVSSPAILNMLGIISSRPCEAVKVVVSAPACNEPWTAPAAPASLCISTTSGTVPKMFLRPAAAQASGNSPKPGRGGDRINRHHLVAQVGDVGRRFIAIDGHEASLFHGMIS